MAIVAVDAIASLHELLRRRPAGPAPALNTSLAGCLDEPLPIYCFPARQPGTPASKLARVDSFPTVPDFFSEPRCDSPVPLGVLPPYGVTDGAFTSFNELPLHIDTAPAPYPYQDVSPGALVVKPQLSLSHSPSEACLHDSAAVQQHHGKLCAGRQLPRRHASDVVKPGAGSRRGSLDLAVGTVGAALSSGGVGGAVAEAGLAEVPNRSLLETALMALWEDRADRGLFRYDVTQCPTRVLPGGLGFVAQLNEGRATKKRPTEFSADRVVQPFDPAKFNFKKAALSEALLAFQPSANGGAAGAAAAAAPRLLAPSAPLAASAAAAACGTSDGASPHLVVINVSPIDYGHVLLLPRVLDQLPQALDGRTVLLALLFARELGSPAFRVGYNSLGAFGTINHLHFHTYYLPLPLPCERAATTPLPDLKLRRLGAAAAPSATPFGAGAATAEAFRLGKRRAGYAAYNADDDGYGYGGKEVRVSRLVGYPVNGFVVEPAPGCADPDGAGIEAVAAVVGAAAERMQAANQPFNLIVSDAGRRVFVFPQRYAERQAAGEVPAELLDTGVNPASFEIAGHLVLKRVEDYEAADEAWAARLLAAVSLDEELFMAVAAMCFGDAC